MLAMIRAQLVGMDLRLAKRVLIEQLDEALAAVSGDA